MNYYTDIIPLPLAEKLKEKGMPIIIAYDTEWSNATFGACFDWFANQGIFIDLYPIYNATTHKYSTDWEGDVVSDLISPDDVMCYETSKPSWHEAAEAAVEKALELIKED